jgi:penicillin amidase
MHIIACKKSKTDFKGVALIAAPGLNVMYGDAKGTWRGGLRVSYTNIKQVSNPNFILTALVVKRI